MKDIKRSEKEVLGVGAQHIDPLQTVDVTVACMPHACVLGGSLGIQDL